MPLERVEALERELQRLRHDTRATEARHDDALDLALIAAVPSGIYRVIWDARESGWRVDYSRKSRDGYGTIRFAHPEDPVHDCSVDLPLPVDEAGSRAIESNLRLRIGRRRAA